jgi:hypothetical protein
MPATHTQSRVAIAVCTVITAFGIASAAQARLIGDPPANSHRIEPIKSRVVTRSTRSDSGYPRYSGLHVFVPAEARTE